MTRLRSRPLANKFFRGTSSQRLKSAQSSLCEQADELSPPTDRKFRGASLATPLDPHHLVDRLLSSLCTQTEFLALFSFRSSPGQASRNSSASALTVISAGFSLPPARFSSYFAQQWCVLGPVQSSILLFPSAKAHEPGVACRLPFSLRAGPVRFGNHQYVGGGAGGQAMQRRE